MPSVLDLPIEKQKELAQLEGYSDLRTWQEDTRKQFEESERNLKEIENSTLSKEEVARMINDLRTNPYAIEYYRRVTDNYDLTVEEQIAHLERVAK